ncbi:MAG: ArsI/CadI family heavy metal resistance metalloenzyme [Gammaproteobacteria bacterium]
MKRLHVHVSVADLGRSIQFYSTLFGTGPSVQKPDYAKWMLEDPRVNFAISERGRATGVDHLGMQAEDAAELEAIGERLKAAEAVAKQEQDTTCCYARSDKYWTEDPQGVRWENFLTHGEATTYAAAPEPAVPAVKACCNPADAGKPGCCP